MGITKSRARQIIIFVAAVLFVPLFAKQVLAQAAISQGFNAEGESAVGTVVSFSLGEAHDSVRPANTDSVERLVGVIAKKQLVELSNGTSQTQVITNGVAETLVSTVNGVIEKGDKLTASPFSGVAMKATESTQVIGTAQSGFSDATQVSERQVVDNTGAKHTVSVGLIPVQVNVSYYQKPETKTSFLPSFLQRFADAVAGRSVSSVRVVMALVILIVAFASVAVLLYSSTRSSIVAIGRNPLSSDSVNRSLFVVGAIAIGILLVMLIAVYLVLVI